MAAAKVYFYTAPPSYWTTFVHPLLRLLTVSKEVERVVLVDLLIITRKVPVSCIFISFHLDFVYSPFVHSTSSHRITRGSWSDQTILHK